ncbi:MAG: bifunctional (p)ppGpp synthetase/guanosine-3',5'-bis(diphosphate) 3'-pyrophosphohydrolase [Actinobacteria bacterium]|nr:bifunctional (p)ppGpp synthetase/guanosine-3',5'-bis(diphosphate) 3'-pyrophosphohydrolase [Actinomycetota bacterium]
MASEPESGSGVGVGVEPDADGLERPDDGAERTGGGSDGRGRSSVLPAGVKNVLARLPLPIRDSVPNEISSLAARIRASSPKVDVREVSRAYEYADAAHDGQMRRSGEPYITHPIAVAEKLADLGLDTATIVAALLHDVVEDTPSSLAQIAELFGDEVAQLVDGVTKLERLKVDSKEQQQAETFRKMILAMASDIRVLLVKLADRLHNMETIDALAREKQKRIAHETLDIYAPLAHRLGMQQFKLALEDLSFGTLHPKRYDEIVAMVTERTPQRDAYLEQVIGEVKEQMRELKIKGEVTGRPKHYYSIYEKMVVKGREFDEIYDLVGIRVIVNSVRDCYAVLGQIHAAWRPVPGRFKDYVAMPKFNLYQSLHTTVIGPKGRPLEIQIRTRAMHRTAEFGVAAHWKYKESARTDQAELEWLQQMLDWQQEVNEPRDYLDTLKIDLYDDEVFVFTPAGDVMALPTGSTPIDFAYAVHTEVGHRCVGARINGKLVPLDHELQNGDTVEILTSKAEDAGPSRDWQTIAVSSRAKSKIRGYFNRERREDAMERGREAIERALRKKGMSFSRLAGSGDLKAVADDMSYKDLESLYRAVGENHVSAGTVVGHVEARINPEEDEGPLGHLDAWPTEVEPRTSEGIIVEGAEGLLTSLARCCTPVPGDEIVGFVTRGRGVTVHRDDCPNVADLRETQEDRLLTVSWDRQAVSTFLVSIQVEAIDRKHLLRDITAVLGDLHINILSAQVTTRRDRIAVLRFSFELADPTHLEYVLRSVKRVEGVYDAYRLVPRGRDGADDEA